MEAVSSVTSVRFTFPVNSFQQAHLGLPPLTLRRQATPFKKKKKKSEACPGAIVTEEALVTAVCYSANCQPLLPITEDKDEEVMGRNV